MLFLLENLQRNPDELQYFFKQFAQEAHTALPDLIRRQVSLHFIGDRHKFPPDLMDTIKMLEEQTAQGTTLHLNVLFCYGGRQEILAAVQEIVKEVLEKKITDVPTQEAFSSYLWTKGVPNPDLVIRTGGYKRLSNFMPYQTAYSELYFTDCLWPDFTVKDLDTALTDYEKRVRTLASRSYQSSHQLYLLWIMP